MRTTQRPAAPRRRLAALALATALTLPALASCSALSTAIDCANTAVTITQGVADLQQAVGNAGNSPQDAKTALDQIDANLKKIGDQTDNADLGKAVDSLKQAVANAHTAVDNGTTPDVKPISDAAAELSKVCTPG
ncbi:hypothetical protein ACN20G_16880 [Streptomyces sp. BI20]|uniref:hypothetical protein n=1 Tax=Streptomyces sp. BI20 TaxID=3403460 RepID=UPI003C76372D